MPIAIIGVLVERICNKKGLGLRALQLVGIGVVVPMIGILALLGILAGETIGTLLGAVVGYLFASKENKLQSNEY